jgi:hypothetical protein
MVQAMHPHQLNKCFGAIGEGFLATCMWTLECREQRLAPKAAWTSNDKAHLCQTFSREPYRYLPEPSAHPTAIAQVIVEWLPALRWPE